MSVGRNFKIEDHLSIEDLNSIIKDSKLQNKICIRAIFIKMLYQGSTITDASKVVGVGRQTGSRWLQRYNEEGFEGLIPKYDGGKPGKLSNQQKNELKDMLMDENSNYTIKEVVVLINELYGIEFSYNRVWTLVRVEFGLWYSKPQSTAHEKPKNAGKLLKKSVENVDLENEYLGFFDSTGGQNYTNSTRTLHAPKTKNRIVDNDKKFKKNFTGFLGVNCESFIMNTPNTRSFQMGLVLTNVRKNISKNSKTKEGLDAVLKNPNLTDKHVKTILKQKRPTRRETIENINDKMYDDKIPYDNLAKNCKNYFKRMDIDNNTKKVDEGKMDIFLKNCEKLDIFKLCRNEKMINLILDRYSVHLSAYIEQLAEILNINLIHLPPYSPDLNPIEDVWRLIKKYISNKFIKSGQDIVDHYIDKFYEEVDNSSLYENWLNEFLNICLKS